MDGLDYSETDARNRLPYSKQSHGNTKWSLMIRFHAQSLGKIAHERCEDRELEFIASSAKNMVNIEMC